jgi:hypothetical protein
MYIFIYLLERANILKREILEYKIFPCNFPHHIFPYSLVIRIKDTN